MIPYKLDYTIEKLTRSGPSIERTMLRIYTGEDFPESEARRTWQLIEDHKWYLSERLGRDVGSHVAAVDYVENFYEPRRRPIDPGAFNRLVKKSFGHARNAAKSFFRAKGRTASA